MKQPKNRVAVLGILYPGIENYLDDYFISLENQTYKDFDMWLFNDGLDKKLLQKHIAKHKGLNIFVNEIDGNYTPAEIREIAIKIIKDKYNYLVTTDTDDYYSLDRIGISLKILQNYDFCLKVLSLIRVQSLNMIVV